VTPLIQVVVRCRPLFGKEIREARNQIVDCDVRRGEVRIDNPKTPGDPPKQFTFDGVYDHTSTQKEIFEGCALPIVRAAIEGYNGTIFCYGQTGTGKTHTMEGKDEPENERGLIPNTFETVFGDIDALEAANKNFLVRASFLEIYNENVRDLLGKDQSRTCDLKEDPDKGVYVKDLTTFVVKSVAEIRKLHEVGKKNRSVGATLMNADSSRSHSIFTVTIETSEVNEGEAEEDAHIRVGKLNMVDLAGSERQAKTGSTGDRLKEATKINLSLSALGNVISALVDGKSSHIPYRDSKLTRLLQDSLGGNTKTVMIANLGPADYNFDETMSTLRYANRAKNIKNKPKINEDPKDAMLREFQEEIARLKTQLGDGGELTGGVPGSRPGRRRQEFIEKTVSQVSDARLKRIRDEMRQQMEENMRQNLEAEEAEKAQAKVQREAQEQMDQLISEKARTEDERAELEAQFKRQQEEMDAKFQDLQREREEQKALEDSLAAMQAKVMRGGTNLLDQEERLREEQRRQEDELRKIAEQEEDAQRRIQELEDLQTITSDSYKTIEEEIESKGKKTKKLHEAYERCLVDIKDLERDWTSEREDLLDVIRALTREIKLKNLVLDAYIPPDEIDRLSRHATWDDKAETWRISHARIAGNRARERREKEANDACGKNGAPPPNERVVAAIAEANGGDVEAATKLATNTYAEKVKGVYRQYKDSSGGGVAAGERRRARPGSARPGSARSRSKASVSAAKDGTRVLGTLRDDVADLDEGPQDPTRLPGRISRR
jgi:kinesin family protein 3/17